MAMSKKDLIEAVAAGAKITKAEAKRAVEQVTQALTDQLVNEGRALMAHVGVFTVKPRAARIGRNPADGTAIDIPAKNAVKFRMAVELKAKLNPEKQEAA